MPCEWKRKKFVPLKKGALEIAFNSRLLTRIIYKGQKRIRKKMSQHLQRRNYQSERQLSLLESRSEHQPRKKKKEVDGLCFSQLPEGSRQCPFTWWLVHIFDSQAYIKGIL